MAIDANFDFDEVVEKLAKVPKQIRLGVVVAIIVGVMTGYYFMIYQDKSIELLNLQGQAEELQRKLNKVRVIASNLDEFEQEVAKLERDLSLVVKQLPSRKEFETLLRDISTAGKKVGVAIKSIERKDEVSHGFYAEVPFKLELEGEYHNIARFFEQMAALRRIVNMGSMDIKIVSESDAGTTLNVKGMATTFRFIEKKG
ncbi:MAG: type 4a pilus biogenesis protein PilO [Myxococcales bacterium]|nr:type 4a pilus biogenesis protein PilO [Myxococcales bacterium]